MKQKIQQYLSIKGIGFEHYDAPPHFSIPKCTLTLMLELRKEFPNVNQDVHPRDSLASYFTPFEYVLFYEDKNY